MPTIIAMKMGDGCGSDWLQHRTSLAIQIPTDRLDEMKAVLEYHHSAFQQTNLWDICASARPLRSYRLD